MKSVTKNLKPEQSLDIWADILGLTLIIVYSFFSSLFISKFAEIHLKIPGLNFPIFIGEILLFTCIVLVFVKGGRRLFKTKKVSVPVLLIGLFCFILIKAFWGYVWWGTLALRNAALFYYPFFAFLAYYFYRRGFFSNTYVLLSAIILIAVIMPLKREDQAPLFEVYFLYSACILMAVLFKLSESKAVRYLGWFLCFTLLINSQVFDQGKGIFFSLIGVIIFLIIGLCIYLWQRIRSSYLKLPAVAGLIIVILVFFNFFLSQRMRHRILYSFNFSKIVSNYQGFDGFVKRNKKFHRPRTFSTKLFEDKIKIARDRAEGSAKDINLDFKLSFGEINFNKIEKLLSVKLSLKQKDFIKYLVFDAIPLELGKHFYEFKDVQVGPKIQEAVTNDFLTKINTRIDIVVIKNSPKYFDTGLSKAAKHVWTDTVRLVLSEVLDKKLKTLTDKFIENKLEEEPYVTERVPEGDFYSVMWRLFVWRDMLVEVFNLNAYSQFILGVDFGKPFRSKSIEVLRWSDGIWVGWLEPHNSFIHILYRAGLAGLAVILIFLVVFIKIAKKFLIQKDFIGIGLISCLLFWLIIANFEVILELPYFAIPFWSLFGLTWGYAYKPN